jgi:hypothetical protein
VPGVLLYTSYYWGNEKPGMAYLRFFLTLFPPAIFAAAWLFYHCGSAISDSIIGRRRGSVVAPIAAGIIVAIASGVNLYSSMGAMERDFVVQTNLADTGHRIRTTLPDIDDPSRRPILFGDQRQLLNYIQSAGRYECYSQDAFNTRYAQRIAGGVDRDAPNPLQKARIEFTADTYRGKSDADLVKIQNGIVGDALSKGRRVFVALPSSFIPIFRNRFITRGLVMQPLEKWREPAEMSATAKKSLATLGLAGGMMYGRGSPQYWEIQEIKRR